MRIEDIDQPRVVPGAADSILRDHEWLGLDWDEGPVWQSTRDDAYRAAIDALEAGGHLYPCTCSRKEIAAVASAPHGDDGVRYPGTCREGPTRRDRAPAHRFRFEDPSPGFDDLLCGHYPEGAVGGDFVLRRADGTWAYQLAVVVDDAQMKITEVVRGDDLLASTPRQLALYTALGYEAPEFVHVPLVTDESGTRLATRHGAPSIESLRTSGRSPESVIGELAFSLGIQATPEPTDVEALVSGFALDAISPAAFVWPSGG